MRETHGGGAPPPPPPPPTETAATAVKRYTPPNQRNKSLNRRKSGDRFERSSSLHSSDGALSNEQNYVASRNALVLGRGGEGGSGSIVNENMQAGLVPLEGCSAGEAAWLLKDRWEQVKKSFNKRVDPSMTPLLYSGGPDNFIPGWQRNYLPHQFMQPAKRVGRPGTQIDFLNELRCAIELADV